MLYYYFIYKVVSFNSLRQLLDHMKDKAREVISAGSQTAGGISLPCCEQQMCSDLTNDTDLTDQGARKEDFHCPFITAWTDRSSQQNLELTWSQQAWRYQLLPLQVDCREMSWQPSSSPCTAGGRWRSRTFLASQNGEANVPHVCTAWWWYQVRLLKHNITRLSCSSQCFKLPSLRQEHRCRTATQFTEQVCKQWGKTNQESCHWCSLEYLCNDVHVPQCTEMAVHTTWNTKALAL